MKAGKLAGAMASAAALTAALFAMSLVGKPGVQSTAMAQNSRSVTCSPLSCYGEYSYSRQCETAKKGWEENRRTCEGVLRDNPSSMESCIHSIDWTVNQPCTCASSACSRATCTKWRISDHACAEAEWRN
jgi:hypothetical protein